MTDTTSDAPPSSAVHGSAVRARAAAATAGRRIRVGGRILGMPLNVVAICGVLLAVYVLLAQVAAWSKNPTVDEPLHALGAWLHLHTGDFRVNPEDPPLWHYWAALPNGRDALRVDTAGELYAAVADDVFEEWPFTAHTLYRTPGNVEGSDAFLQHSRTMMLVIAAALGAVLAWWSWRLGGAVAAITATAAFALDPNFLAHGALVKNDVAFALVVFALSLAVWRAGRRLTVWNALAVCLLLGAGLNVKFSALLLGPILAALLAARAVLVRAPWPVFGGRGAGSTRGRLAVAVSVCAAAAAVGVVSIWACYGFRWHPSPDRSYVLNTQGLVWQTASHDLIRQNPDVKPTIEQIRAWRPNAFVRALLWVERTRVLPQAWVYGLLYTYQSTLARLTYLLGEHSVVGWWYYFPVAMAVKSPLALIAAGALAFGVGGALAWADGARRREMGRGLGVPPERCRGAADRRERSGGTPKPHAEHQPPWYGDAWTVLCLTVPPVIYFVSAVTSNLNLGLRHVLPVYPFIYVGIALAAAAAWRRWRAARIACAALLLALAAESLAAFPNYLAFFNAAAGGPRGGIRLLGDSNLDWGQDLKLLSQWRQANPGGTLYLSYFGNADPAAYGLDYVNAAGGWEFGPPKQTPNEPGWWAISATVLQGIYLGDPARSFFAEWYRTRTPVAVLGGTIYVYEFRGREADLRGWMVNVPSPATTKTTPTPTPG
jgi:hypothetical protein